jgi:hypothetical protein
LAGSTRLGTRGDVVAANQKAVLPAAGAEAGDEAYDADDRAPPTITALAVGLLSPVHAATVLLTPEGGVELRWQVLNGANAEAEPAFKVELARDAAFKKMVASASVAGDRAQLPLAVPGAYYWRVRTEQADGTWQASEPRIFTARLDEGPALYFPADGATSESVPRLIWGPDEAPVTGTGPSEPAEYVVQIAADSAFTQIRGGGRLHDTALAPAPLAPGGYYWRVRRADRERWSEARRLTVLVPVEKAAPLPVVVEPAQSTVPVKPAIKAPSLPKKIEIELPALPRRELERQKARQRGAWFRFLEMWQRFEDSAYAAASGSTQGSDGQPPAGAAIRWPAVEGARGYIVQLARDADFAAAALVFERTVEAPEVAMAGVEPGDYYLRIASIDAAGERSEFSEPSEVTVKPVVKKTPPPAPPKELLAVPAPKVEPPELVIPAEDAELTLRGIAPVVSFKWQSVTGASAYLLQVSRDLAFKDLAFERRSRGVDANVELAAGAYHWRMRSLKGDQAGDWTLPRHFAVVHEKQAQPPPPEPLPALTKTPETTKPTRVVVVTPPPPALMKLTVLRAHAAPSLFSFDFDAEADDAANGATGARVDAVLFNSYDFDATFWLGTATAVDVEALRTSTVLFRTAQADDPAGQEPLKLEPFKAGVLGRRRFGENDGVLFRYADLRAGYGLVQSARFLRAVGESTISLRHVQTHGPEVGAEAGLRITSAWWLRIGVTYLHGVASSEPQLTGVADTAASLLIEQDPDLAFFSWSFGLSYSRLAMDFKNGGAAVATTKSALFGGQIGF